MNISFHIGKNVSYTLVAQQIAKQIGLPRQLIIVPKEQSIDSAMDAIEKHLNNFDVIISKKMKKDAHLKLFQSEYPLVSTIAITDSEPKNEMSLDINAVHICGNIIYSCSLKNLIKNFPRCRNMFIYWRGISAKIIEGQYELDELFKHNNITLTYYVSNKLNNEEFIGDVNICEKCNERICDIKIPVFSSEIGMEKRGKKMMGEFYQAVMCGKLIRIKNNIGIVVNEQCQYYTEQYLASLKAQNLNKNQ